MRDRRLWRGAAFVAIIATAGIAFWFSPLRNEVDPAAIAEWMRERGNAWWAIPAYCIAYAILSLLFVPSQALSIAAVLIWGWWRGGIIELFAGTVAAILPYLITRGTMREAIAARVARHRALVDVIEREGFTLLVILRIIPIIPYPILNYVAGLSSLRFWPYIAATFVGMIPSVFVFAYFVDAVAQGVLDARAVIVRILIAGALLVALVLLTRIAAPRVRRWIGAESREG